MNLEYIFTDWVNNFEKPSLSFLFIIILCSFALHLVVRKLFINKILRKIVSKTNASWDNIFFNNHVLDILTWLIPLGTINSLSAHFPSGAGLIARSSQVLVFFVTLILISRSLDSFRILYGNTSFAKKFPFPSSYMTLIRVFLSVIGILIAVTILMGKSPFALVTGLGAFSAVLMLVFKDTILSFIANIMISTQDLIREGDWIEVPSYEADGDVLEIGLHTIKVQNFDKTVTLVPTKMVLDKALKNWRGMKEAGVRRIKRTINLDTKTINYYTLKELDQLKKIPILKEYIDDKLLLLNSAESPSSDEEQSILTHRKLTNIGTFRKYIELYLEQHSEINKKETLLVRQLQSGREGVPIEIYCFTNTTDWEQYENIQSDIFDHFLAAAESFKLKVFQFPSRIEVSK